ncbi:MAG: hypothetical protein HYS06_05950 [Methylocystis sp.]|nr:hypothetical protein [Methylocystis sp.]
MKLALSLTGRTTVFAGIAFAATTLSPCVTPALAYDDQSTITSLLSLIGVAPGQDNDKLDYHEKPKLVLPPNRSALPEPQARGDTRPGAWPVDQDVARRRDAAARAPAPQPGLNQNPALQPTELDKSRGGSPAARAAGDSECLNSNRRECVLMAPQEAKAGATAAEKASGVAAGVEPSRDYLTEPPTGYRLPTKDVKATRDLLKEKEDAANPLNYIRQQAGRIWGGGQ